MEVVGCHPCRVGGDQASGGQVRQGADAVRPREDGVDHLLADPEVAQGQHRQPECHGLQCRGDTVTRPRARPAPRPSSRRRSGGRRATAAAGLDQRGVQLGDTATTRNGSAARCSGPRSLTTPSRSAPRPAGQVRSPRYGHFGLGGEHQLPLARHSGSRSNRRQERQGGSPKVSGHRQLGGQGGELVDLPVTVHQEDVTARAEHDRPRVAGTLIPGRRWPAPAVCRAQQRKPRSSPPPPDR